MKQIYDLQHKQGITKKQLNKLLTPEMIEYIKSGKVNLDMLVFINPSLKYLKSLTEIMTNYYTPSIEEFYVGFEYEGLLNNGTWEKQTLTELSELNFEKWSISQQSVRVKYLDESDLLELGWTQPHDWFIFKSYKCRFIYNGFEILTFDDSNIFNGVVKNKSELKKLMNMLKLT